MSRKTQTFAMLGLGIFAGGMSIGVLIMEAGARMPGAAIALLSGPVAILFIIVYGPIYRRLKQSAATRLRGTRRTRTSNRRDAYRGRTGEKTIITTSGREMELSEVEEGFEYVIDKRPEAGVSWQTRWQDADPGRGEIWKIARIYKLDGSKRLRVELERKGQIYRLSISSLPEYGRIVEKKPKGQPEGC